MVLLLANQQQCLNKTWQKKITDKQQILSFRLTCCGHRGPLQCNKSPISDRMPCSLARCGPNKRSGRFRRIHAEANLPQNQGPDKTETHDLSSRPNAPVFKLGWPLLLSIASACFLFGRFTSPSKPQAMHQLKPGQAAVALVSETPHPSTPLQRPSGMSGQQHQQQQAFASISAAGFSRLFSGAQRAHLAQLLVYQAQRVSFFLQPSAVELLST